MTEYDNSNRGVLFVNDRKENEKHSDYNGTALIVSPSGEEFEVWVNGWKRTGKSGKTFLSLQFKAKTAQASNPPSAPAAKTAKPKARVEQSLDDEIPF